MRALFTSLFLGLILSATSVHAKEKRSTLNTTDLKQPTTAREVHERVDNRYQGDDGSWRLSMILTNRNGGQRISRLVRYRKKEDGLYRTVLSYVSPSDVKGFTTLTLEQESKDDLQRIYLPAMKRHRRIATQDKGKSWAGTDFSYEDLQEQNLKDFIYSELSTDNIDGHECYHYFSTPRTPDKSSYSKIEYWVRKDIMEPIKSNYFDKKNGRFFKVLRFRKFEKIQGIWTALRWEMTSKKDQHKTVFLVHKLHYNSDLKDKLFTPRSMAKVPDDFKGKKISWSKN